MHNISKCGMEGKVIDQPILTAYGVNTGEKREVLGISVSLSEAEVHWSTFLESLRTRGKNRFCQQKNKKSDLGVYRKEEIYQGLRNLQKNRCFIQCGFNRW